MPRTTSLPVDAYIDRLMDQTAVVRVSIESLAGKARK
jgi:hypothetical protein